jgi:hypothetical protein
MEHMNEPNTFTPSSEEPLPTPAGVSDGDGTTRITEDDDRRPVAGIVFFEAHR